MWRKCTRVAKTTVEESSVSKQGESAEYEQAAAVNVKRPR